MKRRETKEEMEKRDIHSYARVPSQAREFEEWEPEQVSIEDNQFEQEEAVRQTATGEGTQTMEKALEQAAKIRQQLEGRQHSDSTQGVREDRER